MTTKLFCGKCQCLMVGESGTSRTKIVHRYYKCVSVKNHKGCDKKTVKKDWIEDLVIDSIRKLIMNDETIEYLTDLALETFNKESTVLPAKAICTDFNCNQQSHYRYGKRYYYTYHQGANGRT